MERRAFLTAVGAIGLGGAFQPAFAEPYPSGVIRIIVPYSASTPPDILARIIATALSDGEGHYAPSLMRRRPDQKSLEITDKP